MPRDDKSTHGVRDKRVILSRIEKKDAVEIAAGLNNTDLSNLAQLGDVDMKIDEELKRIQNFITDPTREIYTIKIWQEDKLVIIGTIGLHEIDLHCQNTRVGLVIFDEFSGQDYAKEAINAIVEMYFNEHKFIKIYANMFAENVKNRDLFFDCGFELSGTRPKHYPLVNKVHDMLEMSILNRERIKEIEGR